MEGMVPFTLSKPGHFPARKPETCGWGSQDLVPGWFFATRLGSDFGKMEPLASCSHGAVLRTARLP